MPAIGDMEPPDSLTAAFSPAGASATTEKSPTGSQPRRKSPATVTCFRSGRVFSSEAFACSSRAAARCRCNRPAPVLAMARFCRILVCREAPSPLAVRMRIELTSSDATPDQLREIVRRAEMRSPVRDALARALPMATEIVTGED